MGPFPSLVAYSSRFASPASHRPAAAPLTGCLSACGEAKDALSCVRKPCGQAGRPVLKEEGREGGRQKDKIRSEERQLAYALRSIFTSKVDLNPRLPHFVGLRTK